jgi:hypothetical protein
MNRLHTSFASFNASIINENAENEMDMDETILDELVDLVGSESDVEECAREAFEDLKKSFERNEVDVPDNKKGEHLAISALIVKLVEKGKLGPHDADSFISNKLSD